jgi:hypothetical protein
MRRHKFQCVDCIIDVATRLEDLVNEVVFVGGAVSGCWMLEGDLAGIYE